MEKLITQVTSLSDTDFKAKYITLSKPKPKPKPKLNKYHHNQLIKHYKILDSLITAALVSEEALLGAREKIRVNKNGKEAFRALVSRSMDLIFKSMELPTLSLDVLKALDIDVKELSSFLFIDLSSV